MRMRVSETSTGTLRHLFHRAWSDAKATMAKRVEVAPRATEPTPARVMESKLPTLGAEHSFQGSAMAQRPQMTRAALKAHTKHRPRTDLRTLCA